MDEIRCRLIGCFQTVFPELKESDIPAASQESLEGWDSVAAITLVNVIEDEFGIQMDLDDISELNSFARILEYVDTRLTSAASS